MHLQLLYLPRVLLGQVLEFPPYIINQDLGIIFCPPNAITPTSFSLLYTLGYYSPLSFSVLPTLGYYSALGLYSAGKSTQINIHCHYSTLLQFKRQEQETAKQYESSRKRNNKNGIGKRLEKMTMQNNFMLFSLKNETQQKINSITILFTC